MEANLNNEYANSQPHNGFSLVGFSEELNKLQNGKEYSETLKKILSTAERLKQTKETDIKFDDAIILQGSNKAIFPRSINLIQGQSGVHKSRLVENICSAVLKRENCATELLGFSLSSAAPEYALVYIDTERNLSAQFPYALQTIQLNAGYSKVDHPSNFYYTSLVEVQRGERFHVLNEFLELVKEKTKKPLFVVLDVSTDCLEDFNKPDKSLQLIDLMNISVNLYDAVFLCVIHENPGSDKARGHFGTELLNKATNAFQVSFEKNAENKKTDIVKVKYLKCRNTRTYEPFYAKYMDEIKGLVLASEEDVQAVMNGKKLKAPLNKMVELIEFILIDGLPMSRLDFLEKLMDGLETKVRTIQIRLKEIEELETPIFNRKGEACILIKERRGKGVFYSLSPKGQESEHEV
jgi:hypothetical protein